MSTSNDAHASHAYDPSFTQNVINATGPKAPPRMKQIMSGLIRHLHDFAREEQITIDEWMAAVDFMVEAGKMSSDVRNEVILVSDIVGLESLCDEITYKLVSESNSDAPTSTAILGPFYREGVPVRKMGDTVILKDNVPGDRTRMHGTVTNFKTGKPIEGAIVDVWHCAPNGFYDQQDPEQPPFNHRGRFITGPDGKYDFICRRPVPYPIPFDGPAGRLLHLLDRHPFRPAHIHFYLKADGFKPIITQIFDSSGKYLENDSVFAVKDNLVVDFKPLQGDSEAEFEIPYDFKLAAIEDAKVNGHA